MNRIARVGYALTAVIALVGCHNRTFQSGAPSPHARTGTYDFVARMGVTTWNGVIHVLPDSVILAPGSGYCRRDGSGAIGATTDSFRCDAVLNVENVTLVINRQNPLLSSWMGQVSRSSETPTETCASYYTSASGQRTCTKYVTQTTYRLEPIYGHLEMVARPATPH